MKISRTNRFKKAWDKLTNEEKISARKAIEKLLSDMRYPALRVKKIQGTRGIWEMRASKYLRITFELGNDTIFLRNVGKHDATLNNP